MKNNASPWALRLAHLVAASPEISLRTVNYLRKRLAPRATSNDVAQVFYQGLFNQPTGLLPGTTQSEGMRHDFRSPEFRRELLAGLPTSDALEVINLTAARKQRTLGLSEGVFRAAVMQGATADLTPQQRREVESFRKNLASVFDALGPDYVAQLTGRPE